MRHHRLFPVPLALLCAVPFALAQTVPPGGATGAPPATPPGAPPQAPAEEAPQTEAGRAYAQLLSTFQILEGSLKSPSRLAESERAAVQRVLQRAEAFSERYPDHLGALAMQIQLLKWLDTDPQRVAGLFERLMELRPDDVNVALLWAGERERTEELEPEAVLALYRDLCERFPDNPVACLEYGEHLRDQLRYDEAIELVRRIDPDPAEAPKLVYLLADCLFAEHHFEEALAALESIPAGAIEDFELRRTVDRDKRYFGEYIEFWQQEQELRAAEAEADDLPRAAIETARGRIVVELFEDQAPNTVANFISLAESDFYAGTAFHRFVPNFMVQGGDPNSRPDASGTPGMGNPGYYIPDEHTREDHRNHFRDSLAMAKQTRPNTAGCQFYFNHRPTPWLNGRHTVFGRVIEGLEIVRSLREGDGITGITVLRKRDHAYEPETLPLVPPKPPTPERMPFTDRPSGG
ncbi:MAG: peptidylprolyl isomerase [Planctomycetota bacterium]|nr:peptidylprolyl isomerase [Planctomycetota bacterium]